VVVVDDMDMKITHVIRGDDHLNNTPRQINILKALGYEPPSYAHLPMILGEDGQKLSKRHGAASVTDYREQGYLPEALLNYLVRLGWSHGDQEIFSIDEMTKLFDISDINNSASALNMSKLQWINQHYMKNSDPAHVARHLSYHMGKLGIDPSEGPSLEDIVIAYRERAKTLAEMAESSLFFYREFEAYDEKAAAKNLTADIAPALQAFRDKLAQLDDWSDAAIHHLLEETAAAFELKLGKLAQPLRVAVTGNTVSPPIDMTVRLIGKARSVARIDRALELIKKI
jgi:glutamyl-tRNA synthetase